MNGNDRTGVEEKRGRERLTRKRKAEREWADPDEVHADASVLDIKTADWELFAIKPSKAWAQRRSSESRREFSLNAGCVEVSG